MLAGVQGKTGKVCLGLVKLWVEIGVFIAEIMLNSDTRNQQGVQRFNFEVRSVWFDSLADLLSGHAFLIPSLNHINIYI